MLNREFLRFLVAGGIAAAANFGSRFVFSTFESTSAKGAGTGASSGTSSAESSPSFVKPASEAPTTMTWSATFTR